VIERILGKNEVVSLILTKGFVGINYSDDVKQLVTTNTMMNRFHDMFRWQSGQMRRSAKPLIVGSNPTPNSYPIEFDGI
jgi:hypothetical protein